MYSKVKYSPAAVASQDALQKKIKWKHWMLPCRYGGISSKDPAVAT